MKVEVISHLDPPLSRARILAKEEKEESKGFRRRFHVALNSCRGEGMLVSEACFSPALRASASCSSVGRLTIMRYKTL